MYSCYCKRIHAIFKQSRQIILERLRQSRHIILERNSREAVVRRIGERKRGEGGAATSSHPCPPCRPSLPRPAWAASPSWATRPQPPPLSSAATPHPSRPPTRSAPPTHAHTRALTKRPIRAHIRTNTRAHPYKYARTPTQTNTVQARLCLMHVMTQQCNSAILFALRESSGLIMGHILNCI